MIASFILSRTLTPTMAVCPFAAEAKLPGERRPSRRKLGRASSRPGSNCGFEAPVRKASAARYSALRWSGLSGQAANCLLALYLRGRARLFGLLVFRRTRTSFRHDQSRQSDGPARTLPGRHAHRRDSAKLPDLVEAQIQALLPGHVTKTLVNCGLPCQQASIMSPATPARLGSQDCDITISLDNRPRPLPQHRQALRRALAERFLGNPVPASCPATAPPRS